MREIAIPATTPLFPSDARLQTAAGIYRLLQEPELADRQIRATPLSIGQNFAAELYTEWVRVVDGRTLGVRP